MINSDTDISDMLFSGENVSLLKGMIQLKGLSEELSMQIIEKIFIPFKEIINTLAHHHELLEQVISSLNKEQTLSEYYKEYYVQLIEKSKDSPELLPLNHVANCALTLKERIEKNKTSIYEDFFNESSMIDEELNIGEVKSGDLLILLISEVTKNFLEKAQADLVLLNDAITNDFIHRFRNS